MRKILLTLALLVPALAWAGTCGNGYAFTRELKLQKATTSDQSNFPYPFTGNTASQALQTAMLTVANGGQVTHTTTNALGRTIPADVVLCDAASGGNAIPKETASWSASVLGAWELWGSISTLHTASNDSVWVFIGNNSVTTSQDDAGLGDCSTNFWVTAGYKLVAHFPDGTTLDAKDSACNATPTITSATATPGVIDGGVNNNGSSSVSWPLVTAATTNITMSAWIKGTLSAQNGLAFENGGFSDGYGIAIASSACGSANTYNLLLAGLTCGGTSAGFNPIGYYDHIAVTRGASTWTLWANGASIGTGSTNPNTPTTKTIVGCRGDGGACTVSALDEVRLSATTAKSQDWLQTEVNTGTDQTSHYITVEPTGPYTVQITSCATVNSGADCTATMPFPVTSGNKVLEFSARNNGGTGLDCTTAAGSSSPTLTFTQQITSHFTGHLDEYYTCIYTAPVPSTGAQTITLPTGESGTVFMEVANASTSGVVTTSSSTEPPATLTATATSNNSWLGCVAWNVAGAITEPYINFHSRLSNLGGHTPSAFAVYGVVNSGAQNCTFNGGDGASMAILTQALAEAVKHRVNIF
jgi:hypothetical protein